MVCKRQMHFRDALKNRRGLLIKGGLALLVLLIVLVVLIGATIKVPFATTQQPYFNRSIGEIIGFREVGQTFKSDRPNLTAVSFQFSTFGDRKNDKEIIFELRPSIESNEVLRTVRVNASDFIDHNWYEFKFAPLTDSAGKSYYASVRSPESIAGNAVTLDYKNGEVYGANNYLMVVLQNGRDGKNSFKDVQKKDRDLTFMVSHNISGLEFLKLSGVRAIKNFIYSLKNQRGDYARMGQFLAGAMMLSAVILFYKGKTQVVLDKKKYFWLFIAVLVLLGIGLRLMYINQMPYTNDEGFYLYDARTVLSGALPGGDALAKGPIFIGATAVTMAVLGNILSAGRLTSLFFGILTAWPLFILGRRIGGKRTGIIAVALWLLTGAPALFNAYGHTQSVQIFFGALSLALLVIAQARKRWSWFIMAGVILGISIVARKSSLALGLPLILLLLLDKATWKEKISNTLLLGAGMLAVLGIFLGGIYGLYGKIGVLYATGVSLAKESLDQLGERSDLYATYSVNGILPFFREVMPLIFLAFVMLGQYLEGLLARVNRLVARFAWFVPLVLVAFSQNFINKFEESGRLSSGVGLFWSLMGVLIILFAIFPLRRNDKADGAGRKWELLPIIWFMAVAIFYAFWIKFSANYIAEFLPGLVLISAVGAKWLADNFSAKKTLLVFVAVLLVWSNYASTQNAFRFNHTGTFHWSALLEASDYLKKNVPQNALVETGAVAIPYVSGHHVPFDVAHPTWYAYGFIEPYLRNVFMAPAEKMTDAVLHKTNWFVSEKVTEFSYFLEYPQIEKDVNDNFELVKTIENYSNPIRIYKRK